MKMCAQGKARLYPSHGPLRFITSHSPRLEFIGLDPVIHATKKAEEETWIEHLENYTLSLGLHLYCLNMCEQSFWGKGAQRELKSNLE